MGNGEHDEQVEELQGELDTDSQGLDEQDAQGDLRGYDQHLGQLVKQGEQAGFGAQTVTLKRIRRALKNTRAQIEAAEARGRARALEEFQAGNEQAVDALRAEVRTELQADLSRERSLARLGIAPDSPVRGLFDGVQGDHKAFEKQADLLRAAGVSWDADPMVQQIARQRVSAWQEQAAGQNGQGISLDPAGPVPEQVRDAAIAEAVQSMANAQAGVEDLAARFNREMDALSRARQGLW